MNSNYVKLPLFNPLCGFYLLIGPRLLQDEKDLTQRRCSIVGFEDARASWKRMTSRSWEQSPTNSQQGRGTSVQPPVQRNWILPQPQELRKGPQASFEKAPTISINLNPTLSLWGPFYYHRNMPCFCQLYTWNLISFLHTFYTMPSSSKSVTILISPKL